MAVNNVVIVSGLAEGIDTAAMDSGGRAIAVIGTPLDKVYPRKNLELQEDIMRKHLVVSQLPKGHKTTPKDFVLRNRTMALISDATIIVEAGETSGSLHQGWEALRLGRSLFIWKSILANPHLTWPTKMMRSGAMELSDVGDVLEALPSSLPLPYHGPKIMIDEPAPTNMTPQNVVDSANPRSSSSLMLQLRHAA